MSTVPLTTKSLIRVYEEGSIPGSCDSSDNGDKKELARETYHPEVPGQTKKLAEGYKDSNMVSQITKGEILAKTTLQKSAKGPVSIIECSRDGKFVALENTGRKEKVLGNWSLTCNIDGKDTATYKFKEGFVLRAGEKIKVWSKGTKPSTGATPADIETDQNWGIGAHVITKLINPLGEDRASHVQLTKYA